MPEGTLAAGTLAWAHLHLPLCVLPTAQARQSPARPRKRFDPPRALKDALPPENPRAPQHLTLFSFHKQMDFYPATPNCKCPGGRDRVPHVSASSTRAMAAADTVLIFGSVTSHAKLRETPLIVQRSRLSASSQCTGAQAHSLIPGGHKVTHAGR